jgi:signal transduction histidine kinase
MQTGIQHKLKHAQLSGAGSKEAPFNPHVELQGMLQALRAIYRDKSIQYEVDVPDQEFLIDRQDCLELLGNLLDNASKWARQRVRLRMQLQGNGLNLVVEDDGPGCSDAELKILSEPGIWLNKTHGGHGLGMSLIRSIVALYSGKLSFAHSPSLGACRWISSCPVTPRIRPAAPSGCTGRHEHAFRTAGRAQTGWPEPRASPACRER